MDVCPGAHDWPGRYRPSTALVAAVISPRPDLPVPRLRRSRDTCDLTTPSRTRTARPACATSAPVPHTTTAQTFGVDPHPPRTVIHRSRPHRPPSTPARRPPDRLRWRPTSLALPAASAATPLDSRRAGDLRPYLRRAVSLDHGGRTGGGTAMPSSATRTPAIRRRRTGTAVFAALIALSALGRRPGTAHRFPEPDSRDRCPTTFRQPRVRRPRPGVRGRAADHRAGLARLAR